MIFYFSGTGNSEHVARFLAEKTDDCVISISECVKTMHYDFKLKKRERIGFVYPVYAWGLPYIVEQFLKSLSLEKYGKHYTYSVATCGAATGGADMQLAKLLSKRGLSLHATFAIKMVDNYTVVFNVKNEEKNAKINDSAEEQLKNVAFLVNNRSGGYYNKHRGLWPVSNVVHKGFNMSRKTSLFKVSQDCIGCGKCAKNCPSGAISMDYGKPIWVKSSCTMCFACLHRCPVNAINYGPTTKRNGQYYFEKAEKEKTAYIEDKNDIEEN
ncbi:MAG: EFR1 family ferrodoxin [Lachnospiraceae bacterium]|nr:EFR1 family ferrodoxin [Lachnospiraceae bacterium]